MLLKPTQLLGLLAIILPFSSHTVLASIALRREVRALDSYQFLPLCQQTCIAGDGNSVYNNVGDTTSVVGATNCETKECFCVASNQAGIAERVKACLARTTKCSNPTELSGAMGFLGEWCGFPEFSVDTASTTPPAAPTGTRTQPGSGVTAGPAGTTDSCWDAFGSPIAAAGCSTTLRASTTAGYYDTADSPTATSTGTSSSGGSSMGTIAGLAVLGVVLAFFFGAGVWRFYFRLLCCGC